MTQFASFIANQQDGQTPVSINPARVVAVIAVLTPNGRASEFSAIEVGDRVIEVVGSVAEVVAALEAATAPPAPAPVVVEPSDLERAAKVLDRLANAARDGGWDYLDVDQIDDAIEVSSSDWSDTADALIILADRLRGLAR